LTQDSRRFLYGRVQRNYLDVWCMDRHSRNPHRGAAKLVDCPLSRSPYLYRRFPDLGIQELGRSPISTTNLGRFLAGRTIARILCSSLCIVLEENG
jgi:hypothetical protein